VKFAPLLCLLLLIPLLSPAQFAQQELPDPCNGSSDLCSRRYYQVTFPETHNAHATLDEDFLVYAANHRSNLSNQYDAGYRAFMIDAHPRLPEATAPEDTAFCHGSSATPFHPCAYGSINAVELLSTLHAKMNETPRDVVTLLLEVAVPFENIEYIFMESGLIERVHVQRMDQAWPTLEQMIDSGRNLVVFVEARADSSYPWLHDFTAQGWTTDFAESSSADQTCEVYRGDGAQPVWHLNNWLSNEQGLSTWTGAAEINDYDFLLARALECWEFQGRRPTFIAVDWWTEGDAVAVTQTLNAMDHWSDEPPLRATTDSR